MTVRQIPPKCRCSGGLARTRTVNRVGKSHLRCHCATSPLSSRSVCARGVCFSSRSPCGVHNRDSPRVNSPFVIGASRIERESPDYKSGARTVVLHARKTLLVKGKHGIRTQLQRRSALFSKQAACPADAYFPYSELSQPCAAQLVPFTPQLYRVRARPIWGTEDGGIEPRAFPGRPRFRNEFRGRPVTFPETTPTANHQLPITNHGADGTRTRAHLLDREMHLPLCYDPSCCQYYSQSTECHRLDGCPWSDSNAHCRAPKARPSTRLGYRGG